MAERERHITPQDYVKSYGTEKLSESLNAIQHKANYGDGKKRGYTPPEIPSAKDAQKTENLLENIKTAQKNNNAVTVIDRAHDAGIDLEDTVEEAYTETFEKRLAVTPYDNHISDEEKAVLKKQMEVRIIKRFEIFFPIFNEQEEKEIEILINSLPDQMKMKVKKELDYFEDKNTDNIEKEFKKYIEPYIAAKLIKIKTQNDTPGLLHIERNIEPETEEIEIQEITQTPKKSKTGFFKRLFG